MKLAIILLGFLFNFSSLVHAEIKESERVSIRKSILSLNKFKERVPD
jgi:hypothetical protein